MHCRLGRHRYGQRNEGVDGSALSSSQADSALPVRDWMPQCVTGSKARRCGQLLQLGWIAATMVIKFCIMKRFLVVGFPAFVCHEGGLAASRCGGRSSRAHVALGPVQSTPAMLTVNCEVAALWITVAKPSPIVAHSASHMHTL